MIDEQVYVKAAEQSRSHVWVSFRPCLFLGLFLRPELTVELIKVHPTGRIKIKCGAVVTIFSTKK